MKFALQLSRKSVQELETTTTVKVTCYHCGDECRTIPLRFQDKDFCCDSCRLVYGVLQENNLCTYYRFNDAPGISPSQQVDGRLGYLDDLSVKKKLLAFDDGKLATVNFHIPKMHCSSCIWLLENLQRINPGIVRSRVNFLSREVSFVFNQEVLSLRQLVELLAMVGYEPVIRLDDLNDREKNATDRTAFYKIGVSGFAFGNIMLFSFPEYFSLSDIIDPGFKGVFSYINFALSLPVFFYCSAQFFTSSFRSINQKFLNIDVPIALGILVMFLRSGYEIFSGTGPGYMDTMAGLVFFMLLGRWFQDKTYKTLSFDRDYTSFFPVAVMVRRNDFDTAIPLSDLRVGDRMLIRSEEIIPADAVLMQGDAAIDYSFVTGESLPIRKHKGELIYAGGRQQGGLIELDVVKEVSQSYLTQLWNNDRYIKKHDDSGFQLLVNKISHYFTMVILGVSVLSLAYWGWSGDLPRGWNAFTAVLIIACPCALAIASPFTLGNILRIFGRNHFYLRGYTVIEKLAQVDTVVFDKTGTLTQNDYAQIGYSGRELTSRELAMIRSLVSQSTHPLSRLLATHLKYSCLFDVTGFVEYSGKGIEGFIDNKKVKVGSASFTNSVKALPSSSETAVYIAIEGMPVGKFIVRNSYRIGVKQLANYLRNNGYRTVVLTGDADGEAQPLKDLFGKDSLLRFRQSPSDKLAAVQDLQMKGRKVLMVGDGLNDAGALKQADIGISVSEDINNFSPACDGILDSTSFSSLGTVLKTAKASRKIIIGSFLIALVYNVIGCWFAVQGMLSPVIAAVLMPLSTVTIISFTTGMSNMVAYLSAKSL